MVSTSSDLAAPSFWVSVETGGIRFQTAPYYSIRDVRSTGVQEPGAEKRWSGGAWAISAGLEPRPQRIPPPPLLAPIQGGEQGVAEGVLGDGLAAGRDLEGEDLLLDVGGDEREVHELGDAGAGEAEASGEVGEVRKLAGIHAALQGAGERELAGDAGRVAALCGRGLVPGAAAGARGRSEGNDELGHGAVASMAAGSSGARGSPTGRSRPRSWVLIRSTASCGSTPTSAIRAWNSSRRSSTTSTSQRASKSSSRRATCWLSCWASATRRKWRSASPRACCTRT